MHQTTTKRITLPNIIARLSLQRRRGSTARHRPTPLSPVLSEDIPVLVKMPSPPAGKSLNVLCFGDSLTSGYYSYGAGSQPYSTVLAARLKAAFPDIAVNVDTNGLPGDLATFPAFQLRLKRACEKRFYDWVIMLGGTNDLAYRISPEELLEKSRQNWDIPLSKGSKVLALTIPETEGKPPALVANRAAVNKLILEHRQPNFYAFDLHPKIPYHSLTAQQRDRYWDDGLHLTADGYDWMGEHIADGFLRLLSSFDREKQPPQPHLPVNTESQPQTQSPSQTPAQPQQKPTTRANGPRRKAHPDDGKVFDEESGNPGRLSEGYVVVRKKDLY